MRRPLICRLGLGVALVTYGLLLLPGCASESFDATTRDMSLVQPHFKQKAQEGQYSFVMCHGCAYFGGTGVIGPNDEVFWVKEGKVYTVNEAAKKLAPELSLAPSEVTEAKIRAALREERSAKPGES